MDNRSREPLQVDERCWWLTGEPRCYEAVAFVHGFLGDVITTWGDLPNLLDVDPELPELDVMSWGYATGFKPGRYFSLDKEAARLMAGLEARLAHGEPFAVAAHSMGGLITLQGVTERVRQKTEHRAPVNDLALVTLYATPLRGTLLADVFAFVFWPLHRVMPSRQIEALRSRGFVKQLEKRCRKHLDPVGVEERTAGRRLTVRSVQGLSDWIVSTRSAAGLFDTGTPPHPLDEGHTSVKLPTGHQDVRYLVLKVDLARKLGVRLHDLALEVMNAPERAVRGSARGRIARQYAEQLAGCAQLAAGRHRPNDDHRKETLSMFIEIAAIKERTPEAVTRATMDWIRVLEPVPATTG